MSRAPRRTQKVHFLGAGFSKAFGLPLTSELLTQLERRSQANEDPHLNAGHPKGSTFTQRLENVLALLYPDGSNSGFRPSAVDFFSNLSTYISLSHSFSETSFPGGNPQGFMDQLKWGIARLLIERTQEALKAHPKSTVLDQIVRPGAIVVTSNWDMLIELAAADRGVPVRRVLSRDSATRSNEITVLKLHGSVDWLRVAGRKGGDSEYRSLTVRDDRNGQIPNDADAIVRVACLKTRTWQRIRARAKVPHMVTMAAGKTEDLGPLQDIWRAAYTAISMANELEILGYSIPDDDTEIRTLLRAGVTRGKQGVEVHVVNPAPDVHDRVRRYVHQHIRSRYEPIMP